MTDQIQIDPVEMLIGYNKFMAIRVRQSVANKRYRATEHGKAKTNEMHRLWCDKKKDDIEYRKDLNMKARARYHMKKNIKLELAELAKKEIILDETLGKSEIQEKEIIIENLDTLGKSEIQEIL